MAAGRRDFPHGFLERAVPGPGTRCVDAAGGDRRADRTRPRLMGHHLRRDHGASAGRAPAVRRTHARPARRTGRPRAHPGAPARGLVVEGRRPRRAQHRRVLPPAVPGGRTAARRCRRHSRRRAAAAGRRAGRPGAPRPADDLAADLGCARRGRRRSRRARAAGTAGRRRRPRGSRRYGRHGVRCRPHHPPGSARWPWPAGS